MSLQTPTTEEIRDNILAQLEAALGQALSPLPKSFLRVLAGALAAVFMLVYRYAGFTFLQMFVSRASTQPTTVGSRVLTPLEEWGVLFGVGRRGAAVTAELQQTVTVEVQTGSIPVGTQLVNLATQVLYLVVTAAPLDAPTVALHVIAAADPSGGTGAGVIGNVEPGTVIRFVSPVPNVQRDTVNDTTLVQGADAESWDAYRQRVVDRVQAPPQGGAYADYRIWSVEVAGIINAYPYTAAFPGQVDVYAEATPESSGSPDGIPTTPQLQAVLDSIVLNEAGIATRRPAGALPNTFPISRVAFDVEVFGLEVALESEVQTAIADALDEYFLRAEPFISGLSVSPRLDRITASAVGGVVSDVVSAAGGVFTSALMLSAGVPILLYGLSFGEKARLDTVTYPS